MDTFFVVLLSLASIAIIVATLMMEPKTQGMGTISGAETNIFGKSAHKTRDNMLSRITVISAVVFMVSAIVLAII